MLNRVLIAIVALSGAAASAMFYGGHSSAGAAAQPERAYASPSFHAPALSVPRPLPPEEVRLSARRELYESVDALVQAAEFEKARRLLDEDDARFGDDAVPEWRDLEQSYRLMADCLERPSAALRARAASFLLVSEAQGLKGRVQSACRLRAR